MYYQTKLQFYKLNCLVSDINIYFCYLQSREIILQKQLNLLLYKRNI